MTWQGITGRVIGSAFCLAVCLLTSCDRTQGTSSNPSPGSSSTKVFEAFKARSVDRADYLFFEEVRESLLEKNRSWAQDTGRPLAASEVIQFLGMPDYSNDWNEIGYRLAQKAGEETILKIRFGTNGIADIAREHKIE